MQQLRSWSGDWPIRILPCAISPLKGLAKASFEQRVAMLELAVAPITNIIIDKRENNRNGKSFTADTLAELREENPTTGLVLVLGADILKTLRHWHNSDKISQMCHLILVNRPGYSLDMIESTLELLGYSCATSKLELETRDAGRYYCLSIEEQEASSTILRADLASKRPVDQLLPVSVGEYISEHSLYL